MKFERNPWFVNLAIKTVGGYQMRALRLASMNPKFSCANTLRNILNYAKDSEYGKEHHFAEILHEAKNDNEKLYRLYQKHVPVNDYEALRPYVERHKQGEPNVLFPGKPVIYATTSGTTNEPKWIPLTQRYLSSVYGKMTYVWIYNFIKHCPNTFAGGVVFIVGKLKEGEAPDGTIFGSVSSLTQKKAPNFIRQLYASYPEIFEINDYNSRYYTLMRMCIERNITLLITPNPSTILELQHNVDENFDEYVNDIANGTISDKFDIPDNIRKSLSAKIKPNPQRAEELRRIKQEHDQVYFKHFWPDLQLLSTWKCGNTQIYLNKFKDYFSPETFHQELGYFSTECRFGLVLDDTNNTVLFPHFHYYEFVAEEDFGKETPHFYQLHELKEGKRYNAYVTTFSGLYRYNMNDLVEVGPNFMNTPTVHMVQKINGIVSLTGEKLYEQQFIRSVRKAEELTELKTKFFVGFADLDKSTYHFYYEFADPSVTQQQAEAFTHVVDSTLQKENLEYQSKRASFRLNDPITHRLQPNAYHLFKSKCLAEGFRDGQFKFNLLMQDEKRHNKFKELTIEN